ncbi:MAG: CPBP family intramembrane metalloprotease [Nocardioidaceae bacterium]|nr:CPBP family intramembrane metalloprotease [Nocardioidaceae bacterium]
MTSETRPAPTRRQLGIEVWIVLGLSLGQSGVYALVSLVAKLTAGPLRDQTATLNASRSSREYLDLTYQLLGIGFALVPVVLALFLLHTGGHRIRQVLGLGRGGRGRATLEGAGLAALIGLPGLALYFVGRAIGITATVVPSGLDAYWWTVPVLVVSALQNAVLEEVVVVGYLMTRLRQIGWSPVATIVTSALVRGSYHLYQGIGAGIGNVVMGLVFGYFYHRFGRVLPLVVAHTILDVVAFVGYALFKDLLGLP